MAHVFRFYKKLVVLQILVGIAEFGAEQADIPRRKYPQHKQRKCCKRAVDGIIACKEYLSVNVNRLQTEHQQAGYHCRHYGFRDFNPRIGHENIKRDEHKGENYPRHNVAEREASNGSKNTKTVQIFHKTVKVDAQARHYDDGNRHEEHHSGVVYEHPTKGACVLYLPYTVENPLYGVYQREYTVKHNHQSDTDEDACFGVRKVRTGECQQPIGSLWLRRQHFAELCFDELTEAKAVRNRKYHSSNGHYCHYRRERKLRRSCDMVAFQEEFYGEIELLQLSDNYVPSFRALLCFQPHSCGQEVFYVVYVYLHCRSYFVKG